jgi:hypothetical protein
MRPDDSRHRIGGAIGTDAFSIRAPRLVAAPKRVQLPRMDRPPIASAE